MSLSRLYLNISILCCNFQSSYILKDCQRQGHNQITLFHSGFFLGSYILKVMGCHGHNQTLLFHIAFSLVIVFKNRFIVRVLTKYQYFRFIIFYSYTFKDCHCQGPNQISLCIIGFFVGIFSKLVVVMVTTKYYSYVQI